MRPARPVDVVTEAAHAFEPAAIGLGLSIELDTAGTGEVLCEADPDRVGQVVANLVENALKYATSRVTVGTRRSTTAGPAFVDDDGPGIPKEDLERVFERLYQSRLSAGRELGSGLGLAIVDELVKAMGGKVRAESPTSRKAARVSWSFYQLPQALPGKAVPAPRRRIPGTIGRPCGRRWGGSVSVAAPSTTKPASAIISRSAEPGAPS